MKYPNFREEKRLWNKGYKGVVGIDEAGRGPLAGPVVACAFYYDRSLASIEAKLREVKDSKKLSLKKREEIYEMLKKDSNIEWGIGRVSEKVIDKINILEATKLAMKRAVLRLERKLGKKLENNPLQKSHDRRNFVKGGFLLIDGNFDIDLDIPQKSIIKADEKVFSCAAASIIAKVTRDKAMLRYHNKYPEYGFDRHKGYPTRFHREIIKEYGSCRIHRKSFKNC